MALRLLFIPGMMCDHRLFEPVLAYLPSHILTQVCVIPRRPTVKGMAEDIGSQLQGPSIIAGLSLGGIIALEMYRSFASQIKGMVLLNTTPNADDPVKLPMRQQQVRDVQGGGLESVVRKELKPNYLPKCNVGRADIDDTIMQMALEAGAPAFVSQSLALMSRRSNWDVLDSLSCKALIVCGRDDRLCPPSLHRQMAVRAGRARLKIYEDCGHLSSLEAPLELAADIVEFYESIKSSL